jgi:tetratricopeptide (TPR) repeat protein
MSSTFRTQRTPTSWFRIGVLSLLVFNQAPAADSAVRLADREAAKRQMRVDSAGTDLQRASNLMAEGKTDEALTLLESTYTSLPEAPLTHELKAAALAGYVSAGCIRAEEYMAIGKRPEADELLAKLLAASPNDKQVLTCRARLADPDRYPPALTSEHVDNVKKVEALLLKAGYYPSAVLYLVYAAFVIWGFVVWWRVDLEERTGAATAVGSTESLAEPQRA